jgi:hypothetical protein
MAEDAVMSELFSARIPCATAEQMQDVLNGLTETGYSLQSISYSWPDFGARALFKLPARLVKGKWVCGED